MIVNISIKYIISFFFFKNHLKLTFTKNITKRRKFFIFILRFIGVFIVNWKSKKKHQLQYNINGNVTLYKKNHHKIQTLLELLNYILKSLTKVQKYIFVSLLLVLKRFEFGLHYF